MRCAGMRSIINSKRKDLNSFKTIDVESQQPQEVCINWYERTGAKPELIFSRSDSTKVPIGSLSSINYQTRTSKPSGFQSCTQSLSGYIPAYSGRAYRSSRLDTNYRHITHSAPTETISYKLTTTTTCTVCSKNSLKIMIQLISYNQWKLQPQYHQMIYMSMLCISTSTKLFSPHMTGHLFASVFLWFCIYLFSRWSQW